MDRIGIIWCSNKCIIVKKVDTIIRKTFVNSYFEKKAAERKAFERKRKEDEEKADFYKNVERLIDIAPHLAETYIKTQRKF